MSSINISKEALNKHKTKIANLFLLFAINYKIDLKASIQFLLTEGLVGECMNEGKYNGNYFITDKGVEKLNQIIFDSTANIPDNSILEKLAEDMQNLYPKGKKNGTNLYWRGSKKEIVIKLQGFYKRYGDQFNTNQILEATKFYIESFNGNYQYMQLLKYFIWKIKGVDEVVSELASYIENNGSENINNEWTTNLK